MTTFISHVIRLFLGKANGKRFFKTPHDGALMKYYLRDGKFRSGMFMKF